MMSRLVLSSLVFVLSLAREYQVFDGPEALHDLFTLKKHTPAPFIVFFTSTRCPYCRPMRAAFKKAAERADEEKLNIVFAEVECYDIRQSCKQNLDVVDFPEVRYWDIDKEQRGELAIRSIEESRGRRYRQRRDAPSFLHFSRRFAHAKEESSKRPPTAYPFVEDLSTSNFDQRMPFEPEPCYILKSPPNQETEDWFHAKAIQRHDRNAFFVLKEGARANTTKWNIIHELPNGLHIVSIWNDGVHTYNETDLLNQPTYDVEDLDEWIRETPYPGLWMIADEAEEEFLKRPPNKYMFAMYMIGNMTDPAEKETVERFRAISKGSTFGMAGSFGVFNKEFWGEQAGRYGVNFGWFAPGDYHIIIFTENATYWYEDPDYITLEALETEKSLENLLVGHYPQTNTFLNWLWWYSRRVWRYITNWIVYAFAGPVEALVCMMIAFAFTSMCGLFIVAIDKAEHLLLSIDGAVKKD